MNENTTFEKIVQMDSFSSNKNSITAHVIVWAVIYLFPGFLTYFILGDILPVAAYAKYIMIVFTHQTIYYLNYFYIIDHYLFRKNTALFLLINALLFILTGACEHLMDVLLFNEGIEDPPPFVSVVIIGFFFTKCLTILLCVAFRSTKKIHEEAQIRQLLEKQKTEAELKNLKNKLNPHFLFNALNNIYALTAIDQDKAQDAISSLSKLLRYVLYDNDSDMVPLKGELEFTRCYVDLMALRLDQTKVDLDVDICEAPIADYKIATLMLMNVIENAFKHGIDAREHSYINIKTDIQDREGSFWLSCRVVNSCFPKGRSDKSGSGVGLINLTQRLRLIYGSRYVYVVDNDGMNYSVLLEFPLSTES